MVLPPVEWIEKIIRIDSITHHSNKAIVQFLYPLLEQTGLKIVEQTVVENGEIFKNLIAFNHSLDAPNLLVLNTHLDTVSFGNRESWTKTGGNPFSATKVKDRIYGLGSADVKLDFLCKLTAARLAKPWNRPFAIVGTYGEERGLIGATELLKKGILKPKFALVGEPSNLALIYAHKGHIIFSFSVDLEKKEGAGTAKIWKGKSAHSSTPHLGDNALRKALNHIFKRGNGILSLNTGPDTNRIPDLCSAVFQAKQNHATQKVFQLLGLIDEWERELKRRKDPRFNPSSSTLSLNRATTEPGESRKLELVFDLRNLPDVSSKKSEERLQQIAKQSGMKLAIVSIDQPLKGQKNGRLMMAATKALKLCGIKAERQTKASVTEATLYQAHGADAIVFGPGLSIGNVHRPNEYNSIKQLGIATRFYSEMLRTTDL